MRVTGLSRVFLVSAFFLILQGCVLHTMFGTGADFDNAVKNGHWEEAGRIHADNPGFFQGKEDTFGQQLVLVRDNLNRIYQPKLDLALTRIEEIRWPTRQKNWPLIKADMRSAFESYERYDGFLLTRGQFRLSQADKLSSALSQRSSEMRKDAPNHFAKHDHFSGTSFFHIYPLELDAADFIATHFDRIESRVEKASVEKLERFLRAYPMGESLTGSVRRDMREIYITALTKDKLGNRKARLDQYLDILNRAQRHGIESRILSREAVSIVVLDNKSDANDPRLEIPATIQESDAYSTFSSRIRKALNYPGTGDAKYLIVIDPAASVYHQSKQRERSLKSRYYSHSTYSSNPDYTRAQNTVIQAQGTLNQAQFNHQLAQQDQQLKEQQLQLLIQQNASAAVLLDMRNKIEQARSKTRSTNRAYNQAKNQYNQAQSTLKNTPSQLEEKHYNSYRYKLRDVVGTKRLIVNYFVLDRETRSLTQGKITRKAEQNFKLVIGLHDEDPDRDKIRKNRHSLNDIKNWKREALTANVSDIISDYRTQSRKAQKLPGNNSTLRQIRSARNDTIDSLEQYQDHDKPVAEKPDHSQPAVMDYDFPLGPRNRNAFAIILASSNYRNRDIPKVEFAYNDGEAIRQLLIQTMGYDEDNVLVLKDPQQSELMSYFGTDWSAKGRLFDIVEREGIKEIFVYYSGHGVPGRNGKGIILPSDADPYKADLTGYSLETLVKNLNKLPNVKITLAIDSCFSGISDGGSLVASASPVFLSNSAGPGSLKNGVIFTAADGQEIASWDRDHQLGLFTRHLIEGYLGLADARTGNNDGDVDVGEMNYHLRRGVSRDARRLYSRRQTPQVFGRPHQVLNQTTDPDIRSIDDVRQPVF